MEKYTRRSLSFLFLLLFSCALICASMPGRPLAQLFAKAPARGAQRNSSTYERGMVYPRWGADGFAPKNARWQQALKNIHAQSGADWIEMPLTFEQSDMSTFDLTVGDAPAAEEYRLGFHAAHAHGYKVFLIPIFMVTAPYGWSGVISYDTTAQQQAWFNLLWKLYKPYIQAAAREHVEQIALGTELSLLQNNADPALWNNYIQNVRSIYSGKLTYDTNWDQLTRPIPAWMHNAALNMLGISEYIPLVDDRVRVAPAAMADLWKKRAQGALDLFAQAVGKPLILSEVGFRNTSDALYYPWQVDSPAPADPQEQAAAFSAVLSLAYQDPYIQGSFVWGWQETGLLNVANQPQALQAIARAYTTK